MVALRSHYTPSAGLNFPDMAPYQTKPRLNALSMSCAISHFACLFGRKSLDFATPRKANLLPTCLPYNM